MRILLIGNFAPPYEEENLYNLSLLKRLEEDGHECSVINISSNPSKNKKFVDAGSYIDYTFKLLRLCQKKDIVHFSTKGYLRLGLLKLMTSIFMGRLFRARPVVTIHSELFSIAGQMRSPLGGRQTLFTSFANAHKIICADKDTHNVASMFQKKPNLELIPSFIYIPDEIMKNALLSLKKLKDKEKIILFTNVEYPSFLFEILKELISNYPLPSNTGIAVCLSEKLSAKLQHVIEEAGKNMINNLIFIDPGDLSTALIAYSRADIILRPLSCDGKIFFENFAISVKKTLRLKNYIYFPHGLLFLKEGESAELCVCIINAMLCVEAGALPELKAEDSYMRILRIYQE